MNEAWSGDLRQPESFAGRHFLVTGAGVSGATVVDTLLALGAQVTVTADAPSDALDAISDNRIQIEIGLRTPPADVSAVITSPGWRPDHPLLDAALARGLEVFSEPELAWRLRSPGDPAWLAVTGTDGKTTTVTMLASMLATAGYRTAAVGNIGQSVLEAVRNGANYDVLAVELSSFQLHWSQTVSPNSAAILNLADDHLDWHGDLELYTATKGRIWRNFHHNTVAVGNADDPAVMQLLESSPVANRISFTLDVPQPGQLGVQDGFLVDRIDGHTTVLAQVNDVRPSGDHNVANALAAAALARSYGVSAEAVQQGLTNYTPQPHRNCVIDTINGVVYVDDSKATNPHAAAASLMSYHNVVWIAGGLLKGADITALVQYIAPRLRAVVLLGKDRDVIARSLEQYAPNVPVTEIDAMHDQAMSTAVAAATAAAVPGSTVLLAPAAASMDMFTNYAARGEAFIAAVRGLSAS